MTDEDLERLREIVEQGRQYPLDASDTAELIELAGALLEELEPPTISTDIAPL